MAASIQQGRGKHLEEAARLLYEWNRTISAP